MAAAPSPISPFAYSLQQMGQHISCSHRTVIFCDQDLRKRSMPSWLAVWLATSTSTARDSKCAKAVSIAWAEGLFRNAMWGTEDPRAKWLPPPPTIWLTHRHSGPLQVFTDTGVIFKVVTSIFQHMKTPGCRNHLDQNHYPLLLLSFHCTGAKELPLRGTPFLPGERGPRTSSSSLLPLPPALAPALAFHFCLLSASSSSFPGRVSPASRWMTDFAPTTYTLRRAKQFIFVTESVSSSSHHCSDESGRSVAA